MLKVKYGNLITRLHEGLKDAQNNSPHCDAERLASNLALIVIADEKWVTEYLESRKVTDIHSSLTDAIYSGQV